MGRPILDLIIEDEKLRSSVEETARIYFDDENSSTTINLIPAIIILGLLLILGLKLAGIPVLQSFGLDGLVSGGGSGEGGFGVIEERGYTSGGGYEGYDAAYTRGEFAARSATSRTRSTPSPWPTRRSPARCSLSQAPRLA